MWQGLIDYVHNTIKFTHEANPTQIQFLDTIVTDHQQMDELKVKTYIKTTNKQQYIPADSFHPLGTQKAIVIGETYRYRTTKTDEHNFKQMIHHETKKLRETDYPKHTINQHKQIKFHE